MKRVTQKTAANIYNELGYGPIEFFGGGSFVEYIDDETGEVVMTKSGDYGTLRQDDYLKTYDFFNSQLDKVLGQYTNAQLQAVITGINDGQQHHYFDSFAGRKNAVLSTLKMKLRERKLKELI